MGIFAKFFKKTLFLKARTPEFYKILMFFSKKVEYCKKTIIIKINKKHIKSCYFNQNTKEVVWTFKLQFKTVWNG